MKLKRSIKQSVDTKLNIVLSLVLVALCGILHIFIRPAYDDFYYVTFLDNGLSGFLDATVSHYQNQTGRAFVHIILCPLLAFDMLPFKIWNVFIIVSLSAFVSKFASNDKNTFFKWFLLSISAFFLIGTSVSSDGVLWGAGCLNYLFPAFLIVLYSYLFQNCLKNKTNYLVLILTFLSGATVEMSGILAVVAVLYFTVINIDDAKVKKSFVILNLIAASAGYITLFLSGGIKKRLSGNEFYDIGLLERMSSNFSLFCRKICDVRGLGLVVILLLFICTFLLFKKKNYILSAFGITATTLFCLATAGVIYHNIMVCTVCIFAFLVLLSLSILMFRTGERTLLFFMICVTITLGICIVSPIVGYRMLLPAGIYMIVILVRMCAVLNLKHTGVLSVFSMISLLLLIFNFGANAVVIDKNTEKTKKCSEEFLVLKNVPDEMYGAGTVPDSQNFGEYYLSHYGLNAEIIIDEDKVVRKGVEYVPLKDACKIGALVKWRLACAEVDYKGKIYRFTNGANVCDTGFLSIKLFHPVRMINGSTYISILDYNNIFK